VANSSNIVNIIIPHFDKYPLVTSKQLDYLDFKKTLLLYLEKNSSCKDKILLIKNNMNKKRSYEER
jgi:hypothetical protein